MVQPTINIVTPPQSLLKIISNFFQISIDKTLSPIYNKSVLKDEKSTKQVSTSNRTLNLPLNMFEYQTFSCLIVFSSNLHKTFNISQEKERTVILSFLLYMGGKIWEKSYYRADRRSFNFPIIELPSLFFLLWVCWSFVCSIIDLVKSFPAQEFYGYKRYGFFHNKSFSHDKSLLSDHV